MNTLFLHVFFVGDVCCISVPIYDGGFCASINIVVGVDVTHKRKKREERTKLGDKRT